jgi:predicted transposase YdaD
MIESGALPELAPLLALCEPNPGPATLQREREMILGLDAPRAVKSDLLAVALMVGLRFFDRAVLESVFRAELLMLKEIEFIHELFSDEFAEREARGEARGEAQASRRLLLGLLQARFGVLPANVVARIEQTSPAECEALALRLLTAGSLAELGL